MKCAKITFLSPDELLTCAPGRQYLVSLSNTYPARPSLPQVLVVPKGVFDADLVTASGHFRERRPPVWCWGNAAGGAILRSAYTHPELRMR